MASYCITEPKMLYTWITLEPVGPQISLDALKLTPFFFGAHLTDFLKVPHGRGTMATTKASTSISSGLEKILCSVSSYHYAGIPSWLRGHVLCGSVAVRFFWSTSLKKCRLLGIIVHRSTLFLTDLPRANLFQELTVLVQYPQLWWLMLLYNCWSQTLSSTLVLLVVLR